jgi:hypothetical protein
VPPTPVGIDSDIVGLVWLGTQLRVNGSLSLILFDLIWVCWVLGVGTDFSGLGSGAIVGKEFCGHCG